MGDRPVLRRPASRRSSRRQSFRDLSIALARHPAIIDFSRAVVARLPARDRVGRIAAVFSFVSHLVDVPPPSDDGCRDGLSLLVRLAGEGGGPAVVLCAMLQALGERAQIEWAPGTAFARVELEHRDLGRLPPFAGLIVSRGRYYLTLDAREARRPLGFLPRPVRDALRRGPN